MTPDEAVPILARMVRELRYELQATRNANENLAKTVTQLEHKVSGFAYWMRVGKTPARIRELAAEVA